MTVPIYITAAILAICFAYASDRVGYRSPFILSFLCLMVVGFSMCIASSNPHVVYGGVFIATCGIYPAFPGLITWLSNNLSGSYKRSAGMAIQIGIGNLAGAMASNFYRQKDAPRYKLGHSLELGFICVGILATLVLIFGYTTINKKRERMTADGAESEWTSLELSEKGDKAVTWRYML
jgi:MFS family permease